MEQRGSYPAARPYCPTLTTRVGGVDSGMVGRIASIIPNLDYRIWCWRTGIWLNTTVADRESIGPEYRYIRQDREHCRNGRRLLALQYICRPPPRTRTILWGRLSATGKRTLTGRSLCPERFGLLPVISCARVAYLRGSQAWPGWAEIFFLQPICGVSHE